MSDSPDLTNTVTPEGQTSGRPGEVPEAVRRRYLTERRLDGATLYFTDTTVVTPSFRDTGDRLVAARSDPATIRDLFLVAQHRSWSAVQVRGAEGFRREAWMIGKTLGVEVIGYRPRDRDEQALTRRLEAAARARMAQDRQPATQRKDALDLRNAPDRFRVVEAAVRRGAIEPGLQTQILEAARKRIAELQQPPDQQRATARGGRERT